MIAHGDKTPAIPYADPNKRCQFALSNLFASKHLLLDSPSTKPPIHLLDEARVNPIAPGARHPTQHHPSGSSAPFEIPLSGRTLHEFRHNQLHRARAPSGILSGDISGGTWAPRSTAPLVDFYLSIVRAICVDLLFIKNLDIIFLHKSVCGY